MQWENNLKSEFIERIYLQVTRMIGSQRNSYLLLRFFFFKKIEDLKFLKICSNYTFAYSFTCFKIKIIVNSLINMLVIVLRSENSKLWNNQTQTKWNGNGIFILNDNSAHKERKIKKQYSTGFREAKTLQCLCFLFDFPSCLFPPSILPLYLPIA